MPKTFMIGERVKTTHPPGYTDATDIYGVVDRFEDWWAMVLMSKSGVVYPFMEGELEHAT